MGEQTSKEFGGQHYLAALVIGTLSLVLPAIGLGGALFSFLAPVPAACILVIFGLRRGGRVMAYAATGAILLTLLFGDLSALLLPLSLLPAAYVLAAGILGGEAPYTSGGKALVAVMGAWGAVALVIGAVNHVNLYAEMLKAIDMGLAQTWANYRKMPDFPVESAAEFEQLFAAMRATVPVIMPGMLVVSAITIVWANMTLAGGLLARRGYPSWPPFASWRLPEVLVWPLIAAGFMLFTGGLVRSAALNVVLVLATLFQVQGVSVALHLLGRWNVPRPVRVLLLFVVMIQAYGIVLLALLGVADIWADFRKPRPAASDS